MKKIAFIGGGSFGFTRKLVKDILTFPALADCEIALMDIDEERLEYIRQACEKIVRAGKYPATVTATTNRVEALKGADGVVCTILTGDVEVWKYDILIPQKYGVDINVGDTRGPAGIFRALRTIPAILDICADVEKYCPDALFLNYSNPMDILCRVMQTKYSNLKIIGLCHSVQATHTMLSSWLGFPASQVSFTCAGPNHQAFFLKLEHNGEDLYPRLREVVQNPVIFNKEQVRNDMFLHLGCYVTESSGHNSEYVSWYRKRADLLDQYCSNGTSWNPGHNAFILNSYTERKNNWRDEIRQFLDQPDENVTLTRGESWGEEYAAGIFNASFGDGTPYQFYGIVRNYGLIDNLPEGCCVEVPMEISSDTLTATPVGTVPEHLALLMNTTVRCEELAAQAALEGDAQKVYWACAFDPLTSAVLSLEEIQKMVTEMLDQNKAFFPWYKG